VPKLEEMIKRQQVLAAFGEFAIRSDDLDAVLTEACRLVAEATGTGRAKVLEIQRDRQELLVRAGVGWAPDIVGSVRLPMSERSSETYAIRSAEPVVSQDGSKFQSL
jgi:GAF domain-containing protein